MTNLARKLKKRGTNCLVLKQSQWMCVYVCVCKRACDEDLFQLLLRIHFGRVPTGSSSSSVSILRILHRPLIPRPLVFKVPHSGVAFFPSLLLLFVPFHSPPTPHPLSPPLPPHKLLFCNLKKKEKKNFLPQHIHEQGLDLRTTA